MSRRFKKDLIYEYLDKLKIDNRDKLIKEVSKDLENMRSEVSELKHQGYNSEIFVEKYRFYEHLRGLLFFLKNESMPVNFNPRVFVKFKWVAEKLVKIDQMDQQVLDIFNS